MRLLYIIIVLIIQEWEDRRIRREIMERRVNLGAGCPLRMNKGGEAKKSKVNEAGNYTKPGMRKQLFNRIKAGGKGGNPGQWSARKAQMLAKEYKAKGGGYRN